MICKHEFKTLPDQDLYQWCGNCGSIFNIQKNKGQQPRVLDLVEVKHVDLNDLEKSYCKEGNKIMAIKLLRERIGLGLYETKCIVDSYMVKHPAQSSIRSKRDGHCNQCGSSFEEETTPQKTGSGFCVRCF